HQDLPFEKLVEELRPEREMGRTPLFQIMFSWQNREAEEWKVGGMEVRGEEIKLREVKFDLSVTWREVGDGLRCTITYRKDLMEGGAIRRMAGHYQRLLEGIGKDVGGKIEELELLSEREREQILREWKGTKREYRRDRGVHQLFEEQVER